MLRPHLKGHAAIDVLRLQTARFWVPRDSQVIVQIAKSAPPSGVTIDVLAS